MLSTAGGARQGWEGRSPPARSRSPRMRPGTVDAKVVDAQFRCPASFVGQARSRFLHRAEHRRPCLPHPRLLRGWTFQLPILKSRAEIRSPPGAAWRRLCCAPCHFAKFRHAAEVHPRFGKMRWGQTQRRWCVLWGTCMRCVSDSVDCLPLSISRFNAPRPTSSRGSALRALLCPLLPQAVFSSLLYAPFDCELGFGEYG